MATYLVDVLCNECGEVHPLRIAVMLEDGPVERASIGVTYASKSLPPQVARLVNVRFVCPNRNKMTSQPDNDLVFLVPMST